MDRVHTKKTHLWRKKLSQWISSKLKGNTAQKLMQNLLLNTWLIWGPLASLTYKLSTGEQWEVNNSTENYPRDMRRVVHTILKHAKKEVLGCVTIHAVQVNESPSVRMAYIQPGQCQVLLWSESLLLLGIYHRAADIQLKQQQQHPNIPFQFDSATWHSDSSCRE